jgi:two-component system, chemotaxis family, chemotaxis protein CheY
MHALIVDDSSSMRAYLRSILVPLGFEISLAKDGREGLTFLEGSTGCPDLALIDWHMPEMDGYELLSQIRSHTEFDGMVVVMVTAENDLSQISLALDAGANEYMMKPLTKEIVTDKLQMLGF